MLYTLKFSGKKYAYDCVSGAVIQLNSLQLKMLGAICPPLTAVCPTSLRYELAKFDSLDVEETYEYIYSLAKDGLIYKNDDGKIKIITDGKNACPDVTIAYELIALALADAPKEFEFEIMGSEFSTEIEEFVKQEAARLNKTLLNR